MTPDSFSDGGLCASTENAIRHAFRLIEEGADILDIGGESTRPGSLAVSVDEEISRVIPVVSALAGVNVPISVDTSKPEVMQAAIAAGAVMINDVNALRTPGALKVVAASDVGVCLMHMRGEPRSMQADPQYKNVMTEVRGFLQQRVDAAHTAGIPRDRMVIDPGFGFGKTLAHNLELLRNLDCFATLDVPVLAGLSRKSMLGKITGAAVDERIYASIAAALLAVANGARILRVHDVKATRDALAIYSAVTGGAKLKKNSAA